MKVIYIHKDIIIEKNYPIAVKEVWDVWHTDEQRIELWEKLDSMRLSSKIDFTENGTYSIYAEDGSPTKFFRDYESAQEYMEFLQQWKPVSLSVYLDNPSDDDVV